MLYLPEVKNRFLRRNNKSTLEAAQKNLAHRTFVREFPYLAEKVEDPKFAFNDFLFGNLMWEKNVATPYVLLAYKTQVPPELQYISHGESEYRTGAIAVAAFIAYAITSLNEVETHDETAKCDIALKKKAALETAAKIGINFRAGVLTPEDALLYQYYLQQFGKIPDEKGHGNEESDDVPHLTSWYQKFTEQYPTEIIPHQFRELWNVFIMQRAIVRRQFMHMQEKHFDKRVHKSSSAKHVLIEHIILNHHKLRTLQKGLIHPLNAHLKNANELIFARKKKKELLDELDLTTELLYKFYAAPTHLNLVLKDPNGDASSITTAQSFLHDLTHDETQMAGYCHRMVEDFYGRKKKAHVSK